MIWIYLCLLVAGVCAGAVSGDWIIGVGTVAALYVLMPYNPRH